MDGEPGFCIYGCMRTMTCLLSCLLLAPVGAGAEDLTESTSLEITRTWEQEPGGWTYQMLLSVPDSMPAGGYPVCIVLHGANVPPDGLFQTMATELPDHVVVAPTGYELGWNICNEASNAPDMEMVEELIDRMQGFANVNPSAIRIVGFSNGAALANQCFIQNPDPGIDAVVTIVSQLAEIQFRNGSYFAPVADPIEAAPFCGYLQPTAARTDRRYLNICNVNDDTIFYEGGLAPVSGLSYLEARMSAFRVAQQMGYQGAPDLGDGQQVGTEPLFKYAYLGDRVVHLRGFARHSWSPAMQEYTGDFLGTWTIEVDCPGDLDGDGAVTGADLALLLAAWGVDDEAADLDDSGVVDGADLAALLASWGDCD